MKKALLVSLFAIATSLQGADLLGKITLAPVGVVQTKGINGESQYGAGIDIGYKVNDFVGVHVVNLAFEQKDWRDSTVDETDLLVRADITKFKTESFSPYFLGGGQRDWNRDDWGFSVGLGGQFNFTKKVGLAADYSLRAWFKSEKDSLARAYLNISF